ncbi:hypothetical protein [Azohydromonas caseinilytica]|uniref:hypothetical protein n=1 Tax=Azohydromonas caseinilytica TaxID=2728836 RepID=UPI001F429E7C|nr:hypothetical protein [Azohydromonas caseinilytica]
MNATGQPQRCRAGVEGLAGTVVVEPGAAVEVDAPQARWMPVAPEAAMALGGGVHELRFRIEQMVPRAKAVAADPIEKSTFVVPR